MECIGHFYAGLETYRRKFQEENNEGRRLGEFDTNILKKRVRGKRVTGLTNLQKWVAET